MSMSNKSLAVYAGSVPSVSSPDAEVDPFVISSSLYFVTILLYVDFYKILYYVTCMVTKCFARVGQSPMRMDEEEDNQGMDIDEYSTEETTMESSEYASTIVERAICFLLTLIAFVGLLWGLPFLVLFFTCFVGILFLAKLYFFAKSFGTEVNEKFTGFYVLDLMHTLLILVLQGFAIGLTSWYMALVFNTSTDYKNYWKLISMFFQL